MSAAAESTAPVAPRWIVGPRFDVVWFFGGAIASVIPLIVCVMHPQAVLPVLWAWILLIDAPHMAAAYTRTYADPHAWRTHRRALLTSLLGFAAGPYALAMNVGFHSEKPFVIYLGAVALFAYYHVIRQHYGFVALYRARMRERDPFDLALDRWVLNLGCYLPYASLVFTHPRARVHLGLAATMTAPWERAVAIVLAAGWFASLAAFVARSLLLPAHRRNKPKIAYVLTTVLLYGATYHLVGRLEPIYRASPGPDTDFILIAVMVSMFHSVQYVGLIWLHNRTGYRAGEHGVAGWISHSLARYLAVCVGFAVLYGIAACGTGVYPGCALLHGRRVWGVTANQLALALWGGMALHHYLLDRQIWRLRDDPTLQRNLGLR